MREPRRDTKWWGWGDPETLPELDDEALGVLRERIGELRPWPLAAADPGEFAMLNPQPLPPKLTEAVGAERIFASHEDRLRHASGRGYADLARMRGGRLEAAPDAVVLPADAAQLRAVLDVCAAEGIAVVPFGGGTSVVGGVEPLRGEHARLISLDLAGLRAVEVDRRSLTARLGAGLRGPEAEAALGREGLTLGHFPQSFQFATIGGFAATRSAGQASSGYGRFDAVVSSVRLLAPAGDLETLETPHTAAGPALRELIVGSEGVLGVIPDVTVRVRPAPAVKRYEAWMAESFEAGTEIVRGLAQGPGLPEIIRVSDEEETEGSLAVSGPRGLAGKAFDRYLGAAQAPRRRPDDRRLRGRGGGGLAPPRADRARPPRRRRRLPGPVRRQLLGARPLQRPLPARHADGDGGDGRDARDLAHLEPARGAARGGRRRDPRLARKGGAPGLVWCHLSHAYADGASLYFTFIARRREGAELEQWAEVKRAACEAIVAGGGTITHHHAVGRDHVPYMEAEVGKTGLDVLRAVKSELDPTGNHEPRKAAALSGYSDSSLAFSSSTCRRIASLPISEPVILPRRTGTPV